jgi:hypothetical protein
MRQAVAAVITWMSFMALGYGYLGKGSGTELEEEG